MKICESCSICCQARAAIGPSPKCGRPARSALLIALFLASRLHVITPRDRPQACVAAVKASEHMNDNRPLLCPLPIPLPIPLSVAISTRTHDDAAPCPRRVLDRRGRRRGHLLQPVQSRE
jgi:hypothetical protein